LVKLIEQHESGRSIPSCRARSQCGVSGRAMQLIRVPDHVRQFLDVSLKPIRSIHYRCKIHPRPPPKVKLANYLILK
jgi:hypothetical protein